MLGLLIMVWDVGYRHVEYLLKCDFVLSTIDDVDFVKWIVSLTMIIKVACIWKQAACK